MGIPTWTSGEVLTASDVNAWFVPLNAVKGTDETVTSSTALQNDNDLVLAVPANVTYKFDCLVIYTGATGGDIKWTWAVPSGATLLYQCLHNEGGGTGLNNSTQAYSDLNTLQAAGGASQVEAVNMRGRMTTSSTAGNLQLQWAQNSSNATATIMRIQSNLTLQRVA